MSGLRRSSAERKQVKEHHVITAKAQIGSMPSSSVTPTGFQRPPIPVSEMPSER